MPWSGGTFTRTNGTYNGTTVWGSDAAAGVKIQSSRHDTHDQDLATGINACLNTNSSNAPATLTLKNLVLGPSSADPSTSSSTFVLNANSADLATWTQQVTGSTVYFWNSATGTFGNFGFAFHVADGEDPKLFIGDNIISGSFHVPDAYEVVTSGKFVTEASASATTLGSVVKKIEAFDQNGESLGFIPIYNSIT